MRACTVHETCSQAVHRLTRSQETAFPGPIRCSPRHRSHRTSPSVCWEPEPMTGQDKARSVVCTLDGSLQAFTLDTLRHHVLSARSQKYARRSRAGCGQCVRRNSGLCRKHRRTIQRALRGRDHRHETGRLHTEAADLCIGLRPAHPDSGFIDGRQPARHSRHRRRVPTEKL